nr:MAG TPA: hypothetical protein [Caudoviricetes sp.]
MNLKLGNCVPCLHCQLMILLQELYQFRRGVFLCA